MKKVNIFTILAVACIVINLFIPGIVTKDIENTMKVYLIFAILQTVFSIAAIIYAKKIEKSKIAGIILLIIGLFGVLIFSLMNVFLDLAKSPEKNAELCKQMTFCKKGDNGLSVCYLEGDTKHMLPVTCKNSNLTDKQYK